MLKGRENSKTLGGAAPADLLLCFPSRSRPHLTLMPKPICSPVRGSSDPNKRHHHHHLKRLNTRTAITSGGVPGSPLIWAKNNQIRGGGPESSEPTSPKVTCAGQIKVRPRSSNGCKNWQSVMEEIERIHNRTKHKKKSSSSWAGSFGFKKDVMNFLTCLRNVRFDFRCFGSFPGQVISSDDDDDDEEDEDVLDDEDSFKEATDQDDDTSENNAVFSKWFMVLQENNNQSNYATNFKSTQESKEMENDNSAPATAVPPPNALLLMRCRSAPAKSWLEEREIDLKENHTEECNENGEKIMMIKDNEEKRKEVNNNDDENEEDVKEEKKKKRETLAIVMKYDTDFYKLSSDVAQETWVVGGFNQHFSRSRSWRR